MTEEKDKKQDPKPGTPEYDQMMAARFDAGGKKPGDAENKDTFVAAMPEGGFEKYYNKATGAYDWASHAKELEFKLQQRDGKKPADDKAKKPEQLQIVAEGEAADAAVADVITRAGLKTEDLRQQVLSDGDITPEARDALVKAGIPNTLIDEYVNLAKSHVETTTREALAMVGGTERWEQISAWAAKNLPEDDKKKYNQMLAGKDWRVAVQTLNTLFTKASPTGGEGKLRSGDSPASGVVGYASRAEQTAAINDPRYKTDPAYRQQVHARIKVSTFTNEYPG